MSSMSPKTDTRLAVYQWLPPGLARDYGTLMHKFIQIIAKNDDTLYALDEGGSVWRYVPAGEGKNRYSFWTKLTSHRADPAQKHESKE